MSSGVMTFAEQEDGKIHPISYELLGKGREIADELGVELSCVLLGFQIEKEEIDELIYRGADSVFLYDHPSLKEFDPVRYKQNIVRLLSEKRPEIFLIGATHLGRSLGPRIAAALNTGLTADCTDLKLNERELIQIRPAFVGSILAYIRTTTRPQMSTIRYRIMKERERDLSRKGKVIKEDAEVIRDTGLQIINKEKIGGADLARAEVIISGGKGLKEMGDFKLLKELADLCGGVVGSSRVLVDKGWIGKEHQVGFSGNIVKPRLYLSCGISGSPQHLAGMRNSDVIVAVNTDASAPIFKVADYGIVGDLYEVVPRLIDELRKRHLLSKPVKT